MVLKQLCNLFLKTDHFPILVQQACAVVQLTSLTKTSLAFGDFCVSNLTLSNQASECAVKPILTVI